ncbi:MAG: hypothetical protein ACHBN1_32355 [Heteroscytonema crispum UTEX LB 1556]
MSSYSEQRTAVYSQFAFPSITTGKQNFLGWNRSAYQFLQHNLFIKGHEINRCQHFELMQLELERLKVVGSWLLVVGC